MARRKLLFLLFSLLVAGGCSRRARFEHLEKELDESSAQLYDLASRALGYYAADPDFREITAWFSEFCCDDTFDRMDSLVMQQRDLLNRMADCCPRTLRRHLVFCVEKHCELRRLVEAAQNPFLYKEFGEKLRD